MSALGWVLGGGGLALVAAVVFALLWRNARTEIRLWKDRTEHWKDEEADRREEANELAARLSESEAQRHESLKDQWTINKDLRADKEKLEELLLVAYRAIRDPETRRHVAGAVFTAGLRSVPKAIADGTGDRDPGGALPEDPTPKAG